MKRGMVALTALVIVLSVVLLVGPARVRPWNCHHHFARSTPRAALNAYYASCWSRPTQVEGPCDGGTGTHGYEQWHRLDEFSVSYGRHQTRFVLVAEKTSGGAWRVLDGEGTGP